MVVAGYENNITRKNYIKTRNKNCRKDLLQMVAHPLTYITFSNLDDKSKMLKHCVKGFSSFSSKASNISHKLT